MNTITGFGWFVIITATLFLIASIRVVGLFPTILAITGLILWLFLRDL
jgi:hypothetical protein